VLTGTNNFNTTAPHPSACVATCQQAGKTYAALWAADAAGTQSRCLCGDNIISTTTVLPPTDTATCSELCSGQPTFGGQMRSFLVSASELH
jgi:hypothetical protein